MFSSTPVARGRLIAAAAGLVLALSAATGVAHASSTYSSVILGDSPNAYWRLGETSGTTFFDSVGSNDASGGGTLGVTGAIANDANTAVTYPGGTVPDDDALDPTDSLSLEGWVKQEETDGELDLFAKPAFGGRFSYGYFLYSNGGYVCFEMAFEMGLCNYGPSIADGDWHQVVVTFNGSSHDVILYIDGEEVNRDSAGIAYDNDYDLTFGGQGSLDELAIYSYDLSPTQVADHYDAGISTP